MCYLEIFWRFLGENQAEIIALCALTFTAYQTIQSRRHDVLTVRPFLASFVYEEFESDVTQLRFEISNRGLGPAMIRSFVIEINGKETDIESAAKSALEGIKCRLHHTQLGSGYAMLPSECKDVVSVIFDGSTEELVSEIKRRLDQIHLTIRYESAYGKKFSFTTKDKADTSF